MRLEIKLPKSEEIDQIIETNDLDEMGYDARWGAYRLKLNKGDVAKKKEIIQNLLEKAETNMNG